MSSITIIEKVEKKIQYDHLTETIINPEITSIASIVLSALCGTCSKPFPVVSCKCKNIKYCDSVCRNKRPADHKKNCVKVLRIRSDHELVQEVAIFFWETRTFKIKKIHFKYETDDMKSPPRKISLIFNPDFKTDPQKKGLKIYDKSSLTSIILNAERILASDTSTPKSVLDLIKKIFRIKCVLSNPINGNSPYEIFTQKPMETLYVREYKV